MKHFLQLFRTLLADTRLLTHILHHNIIAASSNSYLWGEGEAQTMLEILSNMNVMKA